MIDFGEKKREKKRGKFSFAEKATCVVGGLVLVLMTGIFIQNRAMIGQMEKVLANSEGDIHSIYDNTKVIEAYKSGKTDGLGEKEKWLVNKITSVIQTEIKDEMSPYEKEKAIYDWQVKFVNYSEENLNPLNENSRYDDYTPYGVLNGHKAICVGNATTFQLFMDALEIPCKIIHSTKEGEHAWNIVELDNEWYHVDVTFDGGGEKPDYSFFNVPDSVKDDGAYTWDYDEIPAANGYKYCYIYNHCPEAKNLYEIPKILKKALDKKQSKISFSLKDDTNFNAAVGEYIIGYFNTENKEMYYEGPRTIGDRVIYSYTAMEKGDDGEVSPEILEKLDKSIIKVVGEGSVNGDPAGFETYTDNKIEEANPVH